MRRRVGLFLSCLVIAVVQTESADEPILNWRYEGSRAEGARFAKMMEDRRIQELLLSIAVEPREPSFVSGRLKGSGVEARDLESLRLLHRVGGRYVIRFPLLTRSDLDRIRMVAEDEGRGLAAAMLTRRSEIEAALARTPQNGVDPEAVAYFAVGCVSLDWDGLALTRARGYRTEPKEDAPYLPIAWQIEGGGSKRGLYWGSHNFNDTITFTTFGDHAGRPRVAFPDLGNQIRRGIQTTNAPEQVKSRLGWMRTISSEGTWG